MSTVDEILNHGDGEYWTRDGLALFRRADGSWASTCGACVHTAEQMRLRIERDQHRDECRGLDSCTSHPVPHVLAGRAHARVFKVVGRHFESRYGVTLSEAMDAARALAVTS